MSGSGLLTREGMSTHCIAQGTLLCGDLNGKASQKRGDTCIRIVTQDPLCPFPFPSILWPQPTHFTKTKANIHRGPLIWPGGSWQSCMSAVYLGQWWLLGIHELMLFGWKRKWSLCLLLKIWLWFTWDQRPMGVLKSSMNSVEQHTTFQCMGMSEFSWRVFSLFSLVSINL